MIFFYVQFQIIVTKIQFSIIFNIDITYETSDIFNQYYPHDYL